MQRYGHRAMTVDVPSGMDTTGTSADALADQLPGHLSAPVVAAHSAAGLVLPALAERLCSVHQVWIAAFVPDHAGQPSLLDEIRAQPGALFHPE